MELSGLGMSSRMDKVGVRSIWFIDPCYNPLMRFLTSNGSEYSRTFIYGSCDTFIYGYFLFSFLSSPL